MMVKKSHTSNFKKKEQQVPLIIEEACNRLNTKLLAKLFDMGESDQINNKVSWDIYALYHTQTPTLGIGAPQIKIYQL